MFVTFSDLVWFYVTTALYLMSYSTFAYMSDICMLNKATYLLTYLHVTVKTATLAKWQSGRKSAITKANSAFHPSGVGKWVPASARKARRVWFIPLADERGVCR